MTNEQLLYAQAQKEWIDSRTIQRQYPTFVFYWHELYERVYNISYRQTNSHKLIVSWH